LVIGRWSLVVGHRWSLVVSDLGREYRTASVVRTAYFGRAPALPMTVDKDIEPEYTSPIFIHASRETPLEISLHEVGESMIKNDFFFVSSSLRGQKRLVSRCSVVES
jgi:hypothetical protein